MSKILISILIMLVLVSGYFIFLNEDKNDIGKSEPFDITNPLHTQVTIGNKFYSPIQIPNEKLIEEMKNRMDKN